jgi:hypothetical protein
MIVQNNLSRSQDKAFHSNNKYETSGLSSLNEIDVELDWIGGLKEQVEFLNASMKHHCILFKVQRREFVRGDT